MLKRLTRHPAVQAAGAWLLGQYLALVYATTRWQLVGIEHLRAMEPLAIAGQGAIACFWHERLPMMPMLWQRARQEVPALGGGRRAHVLVSRHRDGRFIGDVVTRFDLDMVYASSSKGGASGLRTLLRLLRAGDLAAITPDGPRGPRRVPAPGVAQLAMASGLPVMPSAAATTRHIRLRSWDRMMLPLPFGRGVISVGAPITLVRGEEEEGLARIKAGLDACTDAADRALGLTPG
ncbi:lysophospholipid acyltransferase family protein [Rhodovarius lipocyclicus]|uniref:lysophospholipid acyltransferase family protein n=1 Tax=Rhodovarius lipocyclicus TaxID=268410 RepID=UPI00135C74B2|nr:lysophospholipid acyltransferase family protein [Rhodovarius lipocyclicus]